MSKLLFYHLHNIHCITVCIMELSIYVLLHGRGRLLFSLHKYSTFGTVASNMKVKLSPMTDGLHTGWLMPNNRHAIDH